MARSSALKKRRRRAHWQILVHCPVSRRGGWQIRDCNPCIAGFRYSAWRRSHRVLPPGGSWWHHSSRSSFGWGTGSSGRRDSGSSLRRICSWGGLGLGFRGSYQGTSVCADAQGVSWSRAGMSRSMWHISHGSGWTAAKISQPLPHPCPFSNGSTDGLCLTFN